MSDNDLNALVKGIERKKELQQMKNKILGKGTQAIINHYDNTMTVATTDTKIIKALNVLVLFFPDRYRWEKIYINHKKQFNYRIATTPRFDRLLTEEEINRLHPEEKTIYLWLHGIYEKNPTKPERSTNEA